ncbi:MAG: hypothetical protein ABUL49_01135 [bacterium]
MTKVLWVVSYHDAKDFLKQAQDANVNRVAIRTSNNIPHAIDVFKDKGIEVYGWRWPSSHRDPAMNEADKAADLLNHGLDGYYVDPEEHKNHDYDDWNKTGLETLAEDFCKAIKETGKPLGVTSLMGALYNAPHLPWKSFFKYADVLLPQSYWRADGGGKVLHGNVTENYKWGLDHWKAAGGIEAKIMPMAGEIQYAKKAEIEEYVAQAKHYQKDELHFYAANGSVPPGVWEAIANA